MKLFLLIATSCIMTVAVFAQKAPITSAVISLNFVGNHATCFGANGDINLQLAATTSSSPYVIGGYTLVLNKDGVYYSTITNNTVQSNANFAISITGLPPGTYSISGTANVINPTTMASYGIPGLNTINVYVGYNAVWTEIKEMAIQTVPSTVLQNVTTPTSTYAGARASNTDMGDFWFLASATFNSGNATNRSVYVSLINTAALVSFNPLVHNAYLEFRKAGSDPNTGDGVYYKTTAGTFKLTGVTYTDKIRVSRSGTSVSFFKDQGVNALASGTTNPYIATLGTQLYLTTFTTVINDGVDIISSYKCSSASDAYATLFNELDGYYYTMKNGKLRFVFNQNYDTQNNLKFNIYDRKGLLMKTQASFPAVQVTYGENYLTLDLTTTNGCIGQDFFILEVISDKKEKMYLRFYNEYNSCAPAYEGSGGQGG